MVRLLYKLVLIVVLGDSAVSVAKMPPPIEESATEPIKFTGGVVCDKHFFDGRLRYTVGVHTQE